MSEELENSLLESIQTYIDERFRGIDQQLSKLQSDFNDALAQAREQAAGASVQSSPLASAITAHLQAAREQKLSGAAPGPAAPVELSTLKRGIDELKGQRTQSDVLSVLLRSSAQFADRAILFVVKGDQAIAWRMCEARDRGNLQPISGVAVSLNGNTVVSRAARSASIETASGTRSEDSVLIEQLRGDAQQLAALPLVVRGKVVAVLYADSAWPHHDAIQLDALEVLTQFAGMAVELASPRVARPSPAAESAVEAPVREEPSAPAPEPSAEHMAEPEPPSYVPQVEAQAPAEAEAETSPAVVAEQPESEPEAAEPETMTVAAREMEAAPEPEPEAPPPPVEPPVEQPVFTEQYSTPLGRARRYGMSEGELPVEVHEDERRLHNDARRFARLLVSEIKLYNEQKVSEGRNQSDLYDRLREDIDRSRQMYDKRVAPPVAARHDYFHQELVNTLADGDPAKLGNSYPGAAVAVS